MEGQKYLPVVEDEVTISSDDLHSYIWIRMLDHKTKRKIKAKGIRNELSEKSLQH